MYYIKCKDKNEVSDDLLTFLQWYKNNQENLTKGSFYPRFKSSGKRGTVAFNEIVIQAQVTFKNARRCLNFVKKDYDIVNDMIVVQKEEYYKLLLGEFKELNFIVEDQPVSEPEEVEFDKLSNIKDMLLEETLDNNETIEIIKWLLDSLKAE